MEMAASRGEALNDLVACSRLVGQEFCDGLVKALAETLGVRTVLLGRFHPEDPGRIATVAAWSDGALIPSFAYDLAGSPCGRVMTEGACHFPDNVTDTFPEDTLLVTMAARGYVGAPLHNGSGKAVGVLAAISDRPLDLRPEMLALLEIFAGRAAVELEREASVSRAEYLGRLIDGSASEIYVFDPVTLRFILVNEGARNNLNYSMQELECMGPVDLKPEFTVEEFKRLLEPLRQGQIPILSFRTCHRRKDGSRYPVQVAVQLISRSGTPVYFAAIEDITQRVAIEDRLNAAQERLQRLFAQSPAGIVETDVSGRMTLVNPTWCAMLGYTEAELLQRTVYDVTHPESLDPTRQAVQQLLAGASGVTMEKNYVHKDGRAVAALSNLSALWDAQGEFMGIAAVVSDVTQRVRAEQRIRESEARLRKILDGTLAFVGVLQPDGTLVEANATALSSSGLAREDVVGRKFWDCHWWTHDPAVQQRLRDAVARAAAGELVRYDEVIRTRDETRATIDFMLTPYVAEDGSIELLVPSGVDISERKKQEAVLRNLMREVNHRSKNILSVVQAIARQMPATDPATFRHELGLRLRSLAACQDILVNNGWQGVQLTDLIRSQLSHFGDLVGDRILLHGPDLAVSPAATQALGMAIYELATNATKYGALSNDRGTVEIRWQIVQHDEAPRFRLHWQERGGPTVQPPASAGFGSTVLTRLITGMLEGDSTSTYDPAGFAWHVDCHPDALRRD